jgi:hypothetical protein
MEQPDWKIYTISKMTEIRELSESFGHARLGYKPNDSRMTIIYAQL